MKPHSFIGASFSHPHLSNLKIPLSKALFAYKELGLPWIRLGCYWTEIEKTKGRYDFKIMEELLQTCMKLKLKVVMTVGMKAPRWPEYYLPLWMVTQLRLKKNEVISSEKKMISESLFLFIKQVIKNLSFILASNTGRWKMNRWIQADH